jgi:hypothetical protein
MDPAGHLDPRISLLFLENREIPIFLRAGFFETIFVNNSSILRANSLKRFPVKLNQLHRRHARACRGHHVFLCCGSASKAWIAGTSPAMTTSETVSYDRKPLEQAITSGEQGIHRPGLCRADVPVRPSA